MLIHDTYKINNREKLMGAYNRVNNLTAFLSKEVKILFNLIILVGIWGHLFDIFTLYNSRPELLVQNIIVCFILVLIFILQKSKIININIANTIALYVLFFSLMVGFYFSGYYASNFQYILLRNSIFASFILSATTLFCSRKHALIILGLFLLFNIPIYTIQNREIFIEYGILVNVVFIYFAVTMYFFSTKLQEAIEKIEENRIEIIKKNDELNSLLDRLKSEAKLIKRKNKVITRKNCRLLVQEQKLKEANATKDRFFSIIAHDLRGPIATADGLVEFLKNKYLEFNDKKRIKFIEAIHNSTSEVSILLNNLLTWSRSQLQVIEIKKERVDIGTIIQNEIVCHQEVANQKSVQINLKNSITEKIFADKNITGMIVRNLMSNAIKFSHENSEIVITTYVEKDNAFIAIKDSGIGIPEEYINNIFDLDQKLKRRGTSDEASTGLGLSLCKDFVEKQGGNIWVTSEENKGSTFYFSLPMIE